MVAVEDRVHEGAIDRPAVLRLEFRQPLAPVGQRRGAFAGPHHGVEREAVDHLGMPFGEQRGAQRTRRDAVDQQRARPAQLPDIGRGRVAIVGAERDRRVVVAVLGGAAIALHVDAPGVVALLGEVLHGGGIRPARHLEIEGRLRGHRGAVHEQDRAAGLGRIARDLVPQEQLDVALVGPVLGAGNADLYVHRNALFRLIQLMPILLARMSLGPAVDLGLDVGAEFVRRHHHRCWRPAAATTP